MRHLVLALSCALLPSSVVAQQIGLRSEFQTYSFSDPSRVGLADARLISAVVSASAPIRKDVLFEASGGFASGLLTTPGGGEARLSGPTGAEAALSGRLLSSHLILRVSGWAPAATATRSVAEAKVAGLVATYLLPFAIQGWQGGGAVGGSATVVAHFGAATALFTGGYRIHGERTLEASDGDLSVRPGPELNVRVNYDVPIGKANAVSLAFGLQQFGDDAAGGIDIFRAGTRMDGYAAYSFPVGLRGSAILYARMFDRSSAEGLVTLDALPGLADPGGRRLYQFGGDVGLTRHRVTFLGQGDVRILRGTSGVCYRSTGSGVIADFECPGGQGWVASVGTTVRTKVGGSWLSPRMVVAPSLRFRFGQIADRESPAGNGEGAGPSRSRFTAVAFGVTILMGRGR
jgi:hypothetical protein